MEIKTKIAVCQCCKTKSEIQYGVDNYRKTMPLSTDYAFYCDFFVYSCPVCGNISFDLSREQDAERYIEKRDTQEFRDIIENAAYDGYETDIVADYLNIIPINDYLAYCYMLEGTEDKELYFRALNRVVDLLDYAIENYRKAIEIEGGEDDKHDFRRLVRVIRKNITTLAEKFVTEFRDYDTDNIFLKLIYAEQLARLKRTEDAFAVVDSIDPDSVSVGLIEYIKSIIKIRR